MDYAIETIELTKTFCDWWGRTKVFAVDGLNLKIRTNEVYGLLGPNGSGKTTTIKMLLGLLYPTKGKALVLGGEGSDPKISARIGFVPEESYLYQYLNPRETLDFYGRIFGLPRPVRQERIDALLDMVGLTAVANRPVGTFSKGMARRIGLAQALINDPDLLILDEPTTGMDPIGTRQIKDLILKLAQRGKTIVLCSHLLADVEDVCDRIAILYGGKSQAEGRVADLLQQADRRQITTGPLSDQALDRIRQIVASEQTDCQVSSPMEKLETYFVRIVTEAQSQATPTSGAVSTTRIGEFLTGGDGGRRVLDDLVRAHVEGAPAPDTDGALDKKVEAIRPVEPDQRLLQSLTQTRSTTTEKVTPAPSPKEAEGDKTQALQKDLLDRLVNPQSPVDRGDKPNLETGDA